MASTLWFLNMSFQILFTTAFTLYNGVKIWLEWQSLPGSHCPCSISDLSYSLRIHSNDLPGKRVHWFSASLKKWKNWVCLEELKLEIWWVIVQQKKPWTEHMQKFRFQFLQTMEIWNAIIYWIFSRYLQKIINSHWLIGVTDVSIVWTKVKKLARFLVHGMLMFNGNHTKSCVDKSKKLDYFLVHGILMLNGNWTKISVWRSKS